jgi:hypothetical protein
MHLAAADYVSLSGTHLRWRHASHNTSVPGVSVDSEFLMSWSISCWWWKAREDRKKRFRSGVVGGGAKVQAGLLITERRRREQVYYVSQKKSKPVTRID